MSKERQNPPGTGGPGCIVSSVASVDVRKVVAPSPATNIPPKGVSNKGK